jgi:hypothetical protein
MGRGSGSSDGGAARSGRAEGPFFFFGCFLLILLACLCAVAVVNAYRSRKARQSLAERRAEEERNNPWTIRDRRGEGSTKDGSQLGGSIVRGFMYGVYVLQPTGSFTFGSSRVETNEKEVRERKRRAARAAGTTGEDSLGDVDVEDPLVARASASTETSTETDASRVVDDPWAVDEESAPESEPPRTSSGSSHRNASRASVQTPSRASTSDFSPRGRGRGDPRADPSSASAAATFSGGDSVRDN